MDRRGIVGIKRLTSPLQPPPHSKANQFSKESLLPRAASAPILAACPPERLQGER